jgi:hypothetical protein
MARITLYFGAALILLGVAFYLGTGMKSVTALIPAFLGLPVAILGAAGVNAPESRRKHTAHAAVVLTLLGTLAGLGRGIPAMLKESPNMAAVAATLLMAALCAAHVALSVRSFIQARKARQSVA